MSPRRFLSTACGLLAALLPGSALAGQGWRWENPLPTSDTFQEVWGSGPNDIFAAGGNGTIVHFDGDDWSIVFEAHDSVFYGLGGSGPEDVYVAGEGSIYHYDGTAWAPVFALGDFQCLGIWASAPDQVYFVGSGSNGPILMFDGEQWIWQVTGTIGGYSDIWGSGPDDLFAVSLDGFVAHFDGQVWTPTWDLGEGLVSVWGSGPDDVWALSWFRIWEYDGTSWIAGPAVPAPFVSAVTGGAIDDLVVTANDGGIYRFNGTQWIQEYFRYGSELKDVWRSESGTEIAVGLLGSILREQDGEWIPMSEGSQTQLDSVWAGKESQLAVGRDGTILERTNSRWIPMESGTAEHLSAVWGADDRDVFAVGFHATVLHFDGEVWTEMDAGPVGNSFQAVWGSGPNDVYASGYGEMYHYDGQDWSLVPDPMTQSMLGLWGSGPGDLFAVGSTGRILHFDGTSWEAMTSGTTMDLNAVWGSSSDDVYAVGGTFQPFGNGIVLHFDGASWSPVLLRLGAAYHSVGGSGPRDVWVGGGQSIDRFNGVEWAHVEPPAALFVHSLFASDRRNVLFTGSGGAIARFGPFFLGDFESGDTSGWSAVVP